MTNGIIEAEIIEEDAVESDIIDEGTVNAEVDDIQSDFAVPREEKDVTITENGNTEVTPTPGKTLRKVNIHTNFPVWQGGLTDVD